MRPEYRYAATCLRVVDADTLFCRVDLGFRTYIETPVRLLGVNAPEKNTQAGKAAIQWVKGWLQEKGKSLVIVSAHPGDYGDKYGRWLASIYAGEGDDQVCLNHDLLDAGHAVVMRF